MLKLQDVPSFSIWANDTLSLALGYAVVFIWIVALLPQMILNFRRRSASGLSPILVCCWLLGDATGLTGAILTKQLTFQIVNATWHLFCDVILTAQWLVFRRLDAQRIKIEDKREAEVWVEESRLHHRRLSMEQALAYHSDQTPMHVTRERPELQGPRAPILPPLLARSRDERPVSARRGRRTKAALAAIAVIAVFAVIVTVLKLKTSVLDKQHPAAHHPIFFAASGGGDPGKVSTFGLVTAYFCASLYLGSRLPQLHHNYSRGSVQGLSISLFVLATAANICYICSILTSSRAVNQDLEWNTKYLRDAFPFFLTAGGAMAFDQVILAQWIYYRGWEQPDPRDRLEDVLARRQLLAEHGESAILEESEESALSTPQLPNTPLRQRDSWLPDERTPLLKTAVHNRAASTATDAPTTNTTAPPSA